MVDPKADLDKLRVEVTLLLKLLIQVSINELPFLKQLYSRKEEKAEAKSPLPGTNNKKLKELWEKALAREAVHLLLLNKPRATIDEVKGQMAESLVKDGALQDQLFAVSDQARGRQHMVTFKLKEQYMNWFDPFYFLAPEKQSAIYVSFQQYWQKDSDLNDIVGDYKGNYKYVTGINHQLCENMARSKIVKIITPLLSAWLGAKLD